VVLPDVAGKDTKPEAAVDSKSLAVMGRGYSLLDPQCFNCYTGFPPMLTRSQLLY